MVDSFSSANTFVLSLYPCASINILKYLVYVLWQVFAGAHNFRLSWASCIHFLFTWFLINNACPKVVKPPVCPCMFGCTACAESIKVNIPCRSSAPMILKSSTICLCQLMLLTSGELLTCTSHLCLVLYFGCKGKILMSLSISDLLCCMTHNSFATNFTNLSARSPALRLGDFSSVMNSHFAARLDLSSEVLLRIQQSS